MTDKFTQYAHLHILIFIAALANLSALFIPILEPDGATYAAIAKNMVLNNNYWELFSMQRDWLDKPHFPFWITALSFNLFGFENWAYKFPGILFIFIGAWYTYRFAYERYNNKTIGLWAALFLLSAQHILMSNNDVRAEPYLTGLIIASFYHFYKAHAKHSFWHLVAGALFAGCAIMTKGMFALFPIAGALAGHFILSRQWKALLHWRWLLAAILIFIFILPELYSLYIQFDAHPEKIVFGTKNVSGIRFFFWDSQFGRFFNTGPIKGKGDPFFFVHTTLWAFLPWSVMLYAGLANLIRWRGRPRQEWYTFAGAMITFLLFSASSFQLPHYINIVFPFFAVITAAYIFYIETPGARRFLTITQWVQIILILIAIPLLHFFVLKPENPSVIGIIYTLILIAGIFVYPRLLRGAPKNQLIAASVFAVLAINVYINLIMYPELMKYQSGMNAAEYVNKHYPGRQVLQTRQFVSYPFDFYSNERVQYIDSIADLDKAKYAGALLFVPVRALEGPVPDSLPRFNHFGISRLTGKFLYHETREAQSEPYVLLPVEP